MGETMPFANIAFYGGRYFLAPAAPNLQKKVMWLAKCNAIPTGNFYHIMIWKKRRSYYFFKSTSGVKEVIIFGQVRTSPDFQAKPKCFFLGSYPIYWNHKLKRMTFVHLMQPGEGTPLGLTPSHPDAWGWKITKENALQYQKDFPGSIYGSIIAQYALIEAWDKEIKLCILKNYDAPRYKRDRIIQTPYGPQSWPGIEWPSMQQPELTTLPTPKPAKPSPYRLWLTITIEFTDPNQRDGLKITLEIF